MKTIGVTVSDKRTLPSILNDLKQGYDLLPIKRGQLSEKIKKCDILYLWDLNYEELTECLTNETMLPNLICIARQGIDGEIVRLGKEKNIKIRYAEGVFTESISEYAVASILMLSKNLHITSVQQTWVKHIQLPVKGSKALILGRGSISTHLKRELERLDINVSQIGRAEVANMISSKPNYKDINQMKKIDHIICCLPLDSTTLGILNKKFFAYFNDANFVNISRGGIVNTESLIEALDNNNVRAILLDAFSEEPLSKDSVLWFDDRVVVSPHQSYMSPDWQERLHLSFINFVGSTGIIRRKE